MGVQSINELIKENENLKKSLENKDKLFRGYATEERNARQARKRTQITLAGLRKQRNEVIEDNKRLNRKLDNHRKWNPIRGMIGLMGKANRRKSNIIGNQKKEIKSLNSNINSLNELLGKSTEELHNSGVSIRKLKKQRKNLIRERDRLTNNNKNLSRRFEQSIALGKKYKARGNRWRNATIAAAGLGALGTIGMGALAYNNYRKLHAGKSILGGRVMIAPKGMRY